jgi:transposase
MPDNKSMTKAQNQYTRAYLIKGACEGLFTVRRIAERLKLSQVRIKQIKAVYRKIGDRAFVHGNTGRIPTNKILDETKRDIIKLKLTYPYREANFAHFTEILAEMGIKYSYAT